MTLYPSSAGVSGFALGAVIRCARIIQSLLAGRLYHDERKHDIPATDTPGVSGNGTVHLRERERNSQVPIVRVEKVAYGAATGAAKQLFKEL
jgi:hypothetical protein